MPEAVFWNEKTTWEDLWNYKLFLRFFSLGMKVKSLVLLHDTIFSMSCNAKRGSLPKMRSFILPTTVMVILNYTGAGCPVALPALSRVEGSLLLTWWQFFCIIQSRIPLAVIAERMHTGFINISVSFRAFSTELFPSLSVTDSVVARGSFFSGLEPFIWPVWIL